MAASRRAQVQALCGARTGPLVDRAESYLSAVDVWSGQGNAKVVKSVGPGLVAVCSWLAAESLDSDQLTRAGAERASGLTPIQFRNAERDLRPAVQELASGSRTPTKNRIAPSPLSTPSKRSANSAQSTPTAKRQRTEDTGFDPNDRSPEALRAKAQAAQSGSLFSRSGSVASNVSTPRSVRFHDHFGGGSSVPHTPTRSSPLKRARYTADAPSGDLSIDKASGDGAKGQQGDTGPSLSYPHLNGDGPEEEQEPNPAVVSNLAKAMRNVVTGLGTTSRRLDARHVHARLAALREKLEPLLGRESVADSWEACSSTSNDLFVWLPLGTRSAELS